MDAEEVKRKAPISTLFAQTLRGIFGDDVKLLRLKEGDVVIGKPDANVYATCFYRGNGKRFGEAE